MPHGESYMDITHCSPLEAKGRQNVSLASSPVLSLLMLHREEFEGHLDYDLGNLMASDPSPQDTQGWADDREAHFLDTATRITQSLVGKLFQLPGQLAGMGRVVTLPAPTYPLPRHKPLPAPRLPTRSGLDNIFPDNQDLPAMAMEYGLSSDMTALSLIPWSFPDSKS